ncbi:MAG: hypothetical protein CL840_11010 [Crocinitomicaceae bacterium]|nr:hypothetical protein [Crocinitomicaceae bacterium]|tara:strand:+ start:513 stop:3380 length:2868 start_codon:yes stop_codon:yes gene_type:complete
MKFNLKIYSLLLLFIHIISIEISVAQSAQNSTCYTVDCMVENSNTVKNVILEGNQIDKLPKELLNCKNVERLVIRKTEIRKLPSWVGEIKKLRFLEYSSNERIDQNSIFAAISNLENLEELNLSRNRMYYLSPDITSSLSLKKLNLSNNYLQHLPPELFTKITLTELDVSCNKLSELPGEIQLASSIKTLNIKHNKNLLNQEAIFSLANMPNLNQLATGPVDRFPKNFKLLDQVKELEIRNGDCKRLNESLAELTQLESLKIIYPQNHLKSKHLEFLNELADLKSLEIISLNGVVLKPTNTSLNKLSAMVLQGNELKLPYLDSSNFPALNTMEIRNSEIVLDGDSLFGSLPEVKNLRIQNTGGVKTINLVGWDSLNHADLSGSNLKFYTSNLSDNSHIKSLNVTSTNTSSEEILKLKSTFPSLKLSYKKQPLEMDSPLIARPEKIEVKGLTNSTEITYAPGTSKSIKTDNGYSLFIPENAFLDSKGKPLTEPVNLIVETYATPLEIALAGIPMTEQNNNQTEFFSSSSMFSIQLETPNTGISINPDNPIQAALPVNRTTDTLYFLDEATGQWEKLENDSLTQITEKDLAEFNGQIKMMLSINKPVEPVMPYERSRYQRIVFKTKKISQKESFSISLFPKYNSIRGGRNYKRFSYIREFKKAKWVYDGNNAAEMKSKLDSLRKDLTRYYKRQSEYESFWTSKWNRPSIIRDIELIPNVKNDNFDLIITAYNEKIIIPCYPEFATNNHDVEAKKIKHFYRSYNRSLARTKKRWNRVDQRVQPYWDKYYARYKSYEDETYKYNELVKEKGENLFNVWFDDSVVVMSEEEIQASNLRIPTRQFFSVRSFGTYNEDIKYQFAQPNKFKGNLLAENGEIVQPNKIIVVDNTKKGTMGLIWQNSFWYDGKNSVSVLVDLPNDKLGVVSSRTLKEAKALGKRTLKLKILDKKTTGYDEIERLL